MTPDRGLQKLTHDRGLSTAVSYVLMLGIVALLVSTMTPVFAAIVSDQQEDAVASNLEVIGHDLAGEIERADRLAIAAGENNSVVVEMDLPARIGEGGYLVVIAGDPATNRTQIRLHSPDHDITVAVGLNTTLALEPTRFDPHGGENVVITATDGTLEVDHAR